MENDYSILLVIFPGQGHLNPALEFSKRLISKGIKVNILTGNYAVNRISKYTPPKGLTITGFSDGYENGFKSTIDADRLFEDVKRFGSLAVEKIIKSSIEMGQPFVHVVYTTLIPWAGRVAHSLGIPSTLFMIQPATIINTFYYYFNGYDDTIRNAVNDPEKIIDLPGLPRLTSRDLPSLVVSSNPNNSGLLFMKDQFDLLDTVKNPKVLVNTFDELEFESLRAVNSLGLVPIGPLTKDPLDTSFAGDLYEKSQDYIEWLNTQENGSVIYVSFGSYSELPKIQTEEIAKGLVENRMPFLWVIRGGGKEIVCIDELEKVGKIVEWCSQVEVLSHPSIGCFVSHCGWNSCLETLFYGVPIVGFPIWIDQGTNAKLMVDVFGVGVRVKLNKEGVVEGSEVKRCLEIVMGEGGAVVRKNAEKWKGLAREASEEGGSSDLNLTSFVNELKGL